MALGSMAQLSELIARRRTKANKIELKRTRRPTSTMSTGLTSVCLLILIFNSFVVADQKSKELEVYIKMIFRSDDADSRFPSTIHYNLSLSDREVTLRLERNERMLAQLPVFTSGIHDEIVEVSIPKHDILKDVAFYQDIDGKAAVSMKSGTFAVGESTNLEGLIFHKGTTYYVRAANSTGNKIGGKGVLHVLQELKDANASPDTFGLATIWNGITGTVDRRLQNMDSAIDRSIKVKRGIPEYTIDMLYVTDYNMFQRWLEVKQFYGSATAANDVIQEMRYYLAHVSNAVDLRYKGINTTSWILRTKLVGFYMATAPYQSSWTEGAKGDKSPSGKTGVDISAALKNFQLWVSSSVFPSALPPFDHAVLFTGYDAYSDSKGARSFSVAGLAYVGTLCGASSVSVAEFSGALAEASTVAHELGHSLSARHDGDGNSCSAASMFIMTASTGSYPTGTEQNYYRFSDCSIAYFNTMVLTLTKKTPNCLADSGNVFDAAEWKTSLDRLPGTKYSANDLCRQVYGPDYEVCGGVRHGARICSTLFCHNVSASSTGTTCVSASAGGRGIDGLTCGDRKWCFSGSCVYDPRAPKGSDLCPIGDFSRVSRVYSNQPYTCSDMPASYCYDQGVFNTCCSTCAKRRDQTRPGCEYGDKTDCRNVNLRSCSLVTNQDLCCKTCEEKKLKIAGCEWGDSISNCAQMYPQVCSRYPKECCATCGGSTQPIVG